MNLDADYFRKKLNIIARDVDQYTPDEMITELRRLITFAKSSRAAEDNFKETNAIMDAAEKYAQEYEGDDREHIFTDVLNAFYAGTKFTS